MRKAVVVVLAFLGLGWLLAHDQTAAAAGDVRVEISAGNALTVTVGPISRGDMIDLVASFFGRGNEAAEQRFKQLLPEAKTITLTLNSAER